MPKSADLVFLFALFFGVSSAVSAHTPTDPNFLSPDSSKQWKTLNTPHFRIHHEAAHKAYAQQMATVAERVHSKLTAWIGGTPEERTEIVILDSVDFSNGAATPLPYNQFYIYMPTPTEDELMDQNPWMEYVFTHEYVHILHLDMAYGDPKNIRNVFGRPVELMTVFTFPQLFAPSWVTEGLAVYGESDNTSGYGRLNNAWYETKMRLEVQRGLRSLTELSFEGYSGSRWPYGQNYLYGAYFFKFVSERYGRDVAVNYIRIYGSNLIPWRMDKRSMQIFGKPADEVWSEFQSYLRQRFEPQLANALKSTPLYDEPYFNDSMTASGNGDLYFYHNDSASHPQVRRIRADGTNETVLETDEVIGLAWNDTSGLLLNKLAVCDNIKLYAELYRWRPGMSSPERLTRCGRYPRAAWRPDGQQIAAVQLEQGLSRLVLLDANGEHPERLAELPLGDTIGQLDWSPDGTRLVASVLRQHSGWNLELFDIGSKQWQQLTQNDDREMRPHFSKDGRSVYFLSDHGKAWNLRRLDIADKTIVTLSDSPSGVYEAAAMPDGSYRLIEYTSRGMSINTLPPVTGSSASYPAYSPTASTIEAFVNTNDYQPMPYDEVQDYSPLSTLSPRSWVPFYVGSADQNSYGGVSLYGADVLGFHKWGATPYLYTSQRVLGGYASYSYLNTYTLFADRQSFVYGANNDPAQYRSDETRYQALLHHSFNATDDSIFLAGGVSYERAKASLTQDSSVYAIYQNTLAGIIARYDDTDFYQHAISYADGRRIQLTAESYDIFGTNYYKGKTQQFDWKEYISLGDSHVLYLRMAMATGDAGIRPYQLGGVSEAYNALDGSTEIGRRKFMLRGYPSGLAALTGTRFGLLTAEWRIPLGLVYDGFFVPPVGLGRHSLSLFVDNGDAWYPGEKMQRKTGVGAAWNGELLFGYDLFHIGTTLGLAHGVGQGGENKLYFLMGIPF